VRKRTESGKRRKKGEIVLNERDMRKKRR